MSCPPSQLTTVVPFGENAAWLTPGEWMQSDGVVIEIEANEDRTEWSGFFTPYRSSVIAAYAIGDDSERPFTVRPRLLMRFGRLLAPTSFPDDVGLLLMLWADFA